MNEVDDRSEAAQKSTSVLTTYERLILTMLDEGTTDRQNQAQADGEAQNFALGLGRTGFAAAASLSREQLVEFLSKIITAQPCDAAPNNPHCELLAGGKIGFPSKLQAASQLTRMCGWDAPQKVNIEAGDSLSAFLREIVTR